MKYSLSDAYPLQHAFRELAQLQAAYILQAHTPEYTLDFAQALVSRHAGELRSSEPGMNNDRPGIMDSGSRPSASAGMTAER